jgi:hypothetical protein
MIFHPQPTSLLTPAMNEGRKMGMMMKMKMMRMAAREDRF